MKKYDIKSASITYFIWVLLSYFLGAFYSWDFVAKNWSNETRDYMIMFGPIFGIFIFLSVLFWEEAFKEENP